MEGIHYLSFEEINIKSCLATNLCKKKGGLNMNTLNGFQKQVLLGQFALQLL